MRPRLILIPSLGIALGLFVLRLYTSSSTEFAWDFAINWTAATALRTGVPLYDSGAMRQLALAIVGPTMRSAFASPYTSYIGPPSTALLYLPLTWFAFPIALSLYRILTILLFSIAVAVAGYSLPVQDRARGWLWGAFALLLFDPVNLSIWIGQVDAWVILALAVTLWAYRRERWYTAGLAIGVATLLKISPGVLLVYCVLRGRYRTAAAAVVTMSALLGVACLIGGTTNLQTFAFVVAPTLSYGSLYAENQSLPAYLARLFTAATDFNTYTAGIGSYRMLSFGIAALSILALCFYNRQRQEPLLTLPALILVALLMGPITWDHYASWAIVPLVSLADSRLWEGRTVRERRNISLAVLVGSGLLAIPALYMAPEAVALLWWPRLLTGTKTIGLMLWCIVTFWLMKRPLVYSPLRTELQQMTSTEGQAERCP